MSWEVISSELRKARIPHKCIWCGQPIEPGLQYRYERVRGPDGMDFNSWHLECDGAHREVSRLYGDDEFTPYDNERPKHLEAYTPREVAQILCDNSPRCDDTCTHTSSEGTS